MKTQTEIEEIQKELSTKDKEEIFDFIDIYRLNDINKVELRRNLERLVYNSKRRMKTNFRAQINRLMKKWI